MRANSEEYIGRATRRPFCFGNKGGTMVVLAVALLVVHVLSCFGVAFAADVRPTAVAKVVDRCGRGALLDIAGQRVLLLAGSPYEMGYQNGRLLKEHVAKLSETVVFIADAARAAKPEEFADQTVTLEQALARTRPFVDARYFEELRGLADGAGLPVRTVQLANIFPEMFHCSGFALFGGATVGGRLLHGRILDYMTQVGLQDHAVVVVAQPDDYNAFVTVGYAGFIGSVTGMNEKQIAIGEMGGGGRGQWDGMPMSYLLRKALEEGDTLQQAVGIFRDTPRTCEYYYVVSDGKIPDARGLACSPERFEVVEPGKAHPQLARPVADTVLMSAGDRYEHLASLAEAQFGQIDVNAALDMMNRPVAMTSCLHRVLFAPAEGELWVANAIDTSEENYAACYQPYYHYRLGDLLEMIPAETPPGVQPTPSAPALAAGALEVSSSDDPQAGQQSPAGANAAPQATILGEIPAGLTRRLPASAVSPQRELLEAYRVDAAAVPFRMAYVRRTAQYDVYNVTYPSPVSGDIIQNNTVHCEYYTCIGNEPRAAVIVLDIMDGSQMVSRLVAHGLASVGVDACIMIMPHYGARRAADDNIRVRMTESPDVLIEAVQQAVMDVRRTARWLACRANVDRNRIGLCGTSLGGIVAALASGVDGTFPRVAFVLAGGDLASVLSTDSREVSEIRRELEKRDISYQQLRDMLEPIEPLMFADRLANTDVLMINGSRDKIVPFANSQKLAKVAGADLRTFETDHYGMVGFLLPTLTLVGEHFSASQW